MDPYDFNEQHRHLDNNSAEMEGLDLTEENIEATANEQYYYSNCHELLPNHQKNGLQANSLHQ